MSAQANINRKAGRYMRKTVLWQSPHVRASLSALLVFVAIMIIVGCGGGGGNGGGGVGGGIPPGQNPLLPFVSGRVIDFSSPPHGIVGTTVTLFAPGLPNLNVQVTSSDGSFTVANVSTAYSTFTVTSPDTSQWYNYALYAAKKYDTTACRLPLPTLVAGNNALPSNVLLYGTASPPAPPVGGCP